ncbi:hypothetical protein FRX31_002310, partial [Thalictrum thalictroides]
MEPEPSAPARKVRFAPKVQPRKPPKLNQPKTEVKEEVDPSEIKELLQRAREGPGRPKVEKK